VAGDGWGGSWVAEEGRRCTLVAKGRGGEEKRCGGLERPFMAGVESKRGKREWREGPGRARGEVRVWGTRWTLSGAAQLGAGGRGRHRAAPFGRVDRGARMGRNGPA
jgi:hypothetical protein